MCNNPITASYDLIKHRHNRVTIHASMTQPLLDRHSIDRMKKLLITAICLSLAACSSSSPDTKVEPTAAASAGDSTSTEAQYTNLGDDASLKAVTKALVDAGIPQADVDAFASQVRSLTDVVPAGTLVTEPRPLSAVKAEDGTIAEATSAQSRRTNCRMTTFTLMHSLITVGDPDGADTSILFIDDSQIEIPPELFVGERKDFDVLYGRFPTTKDVAPEQRIADAEKYLTDHEVRYSESKASVVDVYLHDTLDPQAYSFIGHTGVLVAGDDGLLFVEKLAFDAPYRAIWFHDRGQLVEYLRGMYDDGPRSDYGSPLIFENGVPIAGDGISLVGDDTNAG